VRSIAQAKGATYYGRGMNAVEGAQGRALSPVVRLFGACLAAGSIPLACRLIWEMTWLTWREGPQMIGFTVAHSMPALLIIGTVSMFGAAIWFVTVIVATLLRRAIPARTDWALLALAGLPVIAVLIPYPGWQWITEHVLGVAPLPSSANDLLCSAAANGEARTVDSLLARGLDPNGVDFFGHTGLYSASERGQLKIVSLLLERGANVNGRSKGGLTALHAAAGSGRSDVVKLLLASGADPELRTSANGLTAADLAWSADHPELVNLLEARRTAPLTHAGQR